jgi:hypothetical protein
MMMVVERRHRTIEMKLDIFPIGIPQKYHRVTFSSLPVGSSELNENIQCTFISFLEEQKHFS